MTDAIQTPQTRLPSFQHEKLVDENGHLTDAWRDTFIQLFTFVNKNLSNQGFMIPQQETKTITDLGTTQATGAILYDSKTHTFKGNVNGVFKEFKTS